MSKRSNDGELSQDNPITKKMINNQEFSEILELMSSLSNILPESDNEQEYIKYFNEFKSAIPGLVVWGNQSAGKSTLLKRMFPVLSQQSCEGLGTKCPIELKISVSYKKTNIYLVNEKNEKYEGDDIKNSIAIAEERMNIFFKDLSHIDGKIIMEMKFDSHNLTVTDLPGCIIDNDLYFNKMKDRYLNRLGNIIIYVARGDVDPGADMSLKFLEETKNDMICVLTHTDAWKHDSKKEIYLEKYMKIANTVFLVNDKENNELDYLQKFQNNNKIILGTPILLNMLIEKLNNKLSEMLPTLSLKVNKLHLITIDKLNEIGVLPLDKKDIVKNYIANLDKAVSLLPDLHHLIKIRVNNSYLTIIRSHFNIVPQSNLLYVEVQKTNEVSGWDSVFKIYLNKMIQITITYLSKLIDGHFDTITEKLLDINYEYKSRTKNVEKSIKSNIVIFIANAKENAKNNLIELINEIMTNNTDKKYKEKYYQAIIDMRINMYSPIVTKVCSSRIKIKSLENTTEIRNEIMLTNPDLIDAKEKYILLEHIWNYKCEKIMNVFVNPIDKYRDILKNNILEMINNIKIDEIDDEPIEQIDFRKNLLEIEESCRNLKCKINCYSSPGLNEISNNYS